MSKFSLNVAGNLKIFFTKLTNQFRSLIAVNSIASLLMNSPWGGPWQTNQGSSQGKSQDANKGNSSSGGGNQGQNGSNSDQNPKKDDEKDKKSSQENQGAGRSSKPMDDQKNQSSSEKIGFKNPFEKTSQSQDKYTSKKQNQSDFSDFFKKISKKFNEFFEGNGGGNSQNGGDGLPKSTIGAIALGVVLLWLSLGFYKVDPEENAVTLYFGKFYKIAQPGLNYHIPYPFGQVIKKSVITVNTEEFGFSSLSNKKNSRDFSAESLMLTGDENIVDVQFQVQWQISDIKDFVFNIASPNESIRKSAESAMREVIAQTPIVEALSDGKQGIEQKTKSLLQEILDSYQAGVRVVMVQLRRVDPPEQVINAFRDVQTAKADKEKEINEAQAYANDIIPRARGMASQMKEESEAYAKQVVANAQGEAARFLSVYNQYVKAKQVTKRRIYLETMEKIYRDMDKVYIDKGASKSFFGQLPINDFGKNGENSGSETKSTAKK